MPCGLHPSENYMHQKMIHFQNTDDKKTGCGIKSGAGPAQPRRLPGESQRESHLKLPTRPCLSSTQPGVRGGSWAARTRGRCSPSSVCGWLSGWAAGDAMHTCRHPWGRSRVAFPFRSDSILGLHVPREWHVGSRPRRCRVQGCGRKFRIDDLATSDWKRSR